LYLIFLWAYTRIRTSGPFLSMTTFQQAWYWYVLLGIASAYFLVFWKDVYPTHCCDACQGKGRVEETVTEEIE